MGTDIHGVVQRWDEESGKWETLHEGYRDRNYNAFAILANVRNGRGFGGIVTSTEFDFIDEPRGFPADVDGDEVDGVWLGDHSHSFVMADEILKFLQVPQEVVKVGVIPESAYLEWRKKAPDYPESWAAGVSGPGVVTIPMEMYEGSIGCLRRPWPEGTKVYVRVSWKVTYRDAVGDALFEFAKELAAYGDQYGGPQNVRWVFGFDS